MAIAAAGPYIYDDVEWVWNSVDLSDHVAGVNTDLTVDEQEVSAMGDAWKEFLMGVPSGVVTLDLYQDYYTSEVDATLRSDWANRTSRTSTLMPDKTAGIGTTNPKATFSAYITSYPWIAGEFNAVAKVSVSLRITGAITWTTA